MWVVCLHVCLCVTYVPEAIRDQKRVLNSMELELQTIVSYHVGTRNWTWVLGKSSLSVLITEPYLHMILTFYPILRQFIQLKKVFNKMLLQYLDTNKINDNIKEQLKCNSREIKEMPLSLTVLFCFMKIKSEE